MSHSTDSTYLQWTTPECPFAIEYSARVVDDIRLAVVDAFFSLPRGGVEIGGILLGSIEADRVTISDSAPLDCEHALGPSFTLSPNDLGKLRRQLAEMPSSGTARPVGWYHSHTRSGIFLSEADLEIHSRFFPDPRQVALVVRPHAFDPVRAGFFFRAPDGSVHETASYREFALDPLPMHQIPVHPAAASPAPPVTGREPAAPGPVVDISPPPPVHPEPEPAPVAAQPDPVPVAAAPLIVHPEPAPPPAPPVPSVSAPEPPVTALALPAPPSEPAAVEPPRFLAEPPPSSRRWTAILALAGIGAVAAGAYATRDRWQPWVASLTREAASHSAPAAGLGLTATDAAGQLQIRWNPAAPGIRKGTGALLMIVDGGGAPQAKGLDLALLQSGAFVYGRRSGKVEITLTVHQRGGAEARESTAFQGPDPAPGGSPREQELVERTTRLQTDLDKQAARTRKLEKTIEDMKRRMENQIPDRDKQ